jgi:hypothetical protein
LSRSADSDDLRSIVDKATGVSEEKPEHRARRQPSARVFRIVLGIAMVVGGSGGFGYSLIRLLHTGTCASGNTPYVIARQCPSGTGWLIGLLIGSIFVALIGAGVAGVGLALPGGLAFTGVGAAALYVGITGAGNAGGTSAGYSVGITFLVMGLGYLAWAIWSWRGSRDDSAPRVSVVGISQMIAATAPKPLDSKELPEDETPKQGG